MTFDDKLNELINEVEVPDELSPQNIALMLKAKNAQSKMEAEHREIRSAPSISAQRHNIIMRTAAAAAACAVFAAGMIAFSEHNKYDGQIEDQIDYAAVSPDSYDDLYNIYTGIYLDGGSSDTEKETESDMTTAPNDSEPAIVGTEPEPEETLSEFSSFDFSAIDDDRVSEADIVKSDGTNLYCITNGRLYIVSLETMEVTAEVENKLNPPVELYIDGDTLILVSKENEEIQIVDTSEGLSDNSITASDVPADDTDSYSTTDGANVDSDLPEINSYDGAVNDTASQKICRTNVVVDIYDISDKTNPLHTTTYKQNGSYTSSKIVDGILYTVTGYCDYRTKPLDKEADLDSYVPAYYIDGEKHYVAAGDITVPANANSTDYTVVSAIDFKSGVKDVTVKAVLGNSKNVYCSADTLYIVGVGKSRSESDYSIITSFDLSNPSGITYKASGSVAGKVLNQYSMNEYGGLFRIAASVSDKGSKSVSVYVLDSSLTAVNSAGQLLPDENVTAVRFEENYASIYTGDGKEPSIVIDLSANPPVQVQSLAGTSAYLFSYSDDKLLGLGENAEGTALTLTMYSADNGSMLNAAVFADELTDICSKALTDRRALLIDKEHSIIGVPVYSHTEFGTKNQYYVFEYTDEGFVQKGVIEYSDIDDSGVFVRGVINGETLYLISNTRIVSVQLSDLKVIDSYEF